MDTAPEQSGDAGYTALPAHRRAKPSRHLAAIGPQERELVARWIDDQIPGYEDVAAQILHLDRQGANIAQLRGQLSFAQVAVSVLKKLSWDMRTVKGGPLAGMGRKAQRKATNP